MYTTIRTDISVEIRSETEAKILRSPRRIEYTYLTSDTKQGLWRQIAAITRSVHILHNAPPVVKLYTKDDIRLVYVEHNLSHQILSITPH